MTGPYAFGSNLGWQKGRGRGAGEPAGGAAQEKKKPCEVITWMAGVLRTV